jgi:hypothetical protein
MKSGSPLEIWKPKPGEVFGFDTLVGRGGSRKGNNPGHFGDLGSDLEGDQLKPVKGEEEIREEEARHLQGDGYPKRGSAG